MPQLPVLNAEGPAGQVRYPMPTAEELGAQGAQAMTRAGERESEELTHLGRIQLTLQHQQDELQAATLAAQYDDGLKEIQLGLTQNPDATSHQAIYKQEAGRLQADLLKQAVNPSVATALQRHMVRSFARDDIEVRTNALKVFNNQQVAALDTLQETLSKQAAEAPTPEDATGPIATYNDLVVRARDRGVITAVDAEERQRKFQARVGEKSMVIMSYKDPTALRELDRQGAYNAVPEDRRLKILEETRNREAADTARNDKAFREAQAVVLNARNAQANSGKLNDADLAAGLAGKDPFVSAAEWRHLKEVNDNPPSGNDKQAVLSVMADFALYPVTDASIRRAQAALRKIQQASTRANPALVQAGEHLQSSWNALHNVQAAETQAGIKKADDLLKGQAEPNLFGGAIGRMYHGLVEQDRARVHTLIRGGMTAEKAVEQVQKERKAKKDAMPGELKGTLDLAQPGN